MRASAHPVRRGLWPLAMGAALLASSACRPEGPAEYVTAMNLGKAHLEIRDSARALEAFSRAVRIEPGSAPALRNLARAHLLARDTENALATLDRARAAEGEAAATSYLTGIAHARLSQFEQAVPHFEEAVRLDPHVAPLHYQLASAYQATNRADPAVRELRETLRLDPLHVSAHYRLGNYARRSGHRDDLARHQREVIRLRKLFGEETRSAEMLEVCVYTKAEPAATTRNGRPVDDEVIDVRFREATPDLLPSTAGVEAAIAVAVLDMDDAGRYTLFVAMQDGTLGLLAPGPDGPLALTTLDLQLAGSAVLRPGAQCIVGNYHDGSSGSAIQEAAAHAGNDVLLLGPGGAHLLRRTGPQSFEDVTVAAGLSGLAGHRARWVDHEHDGDIDLLVAGSQGLTLWQNHGDGRFEEVLAAMELAEIGPVTDLAVADLDENLAIDLVLARGTRPTLVLENSRDGRFAPQAEPPGPWPAARLLLTDDLDNDGHVDTVLVGHDEVRVLAGRLGTRQHLDLAGIDPSAGVLLDFDNDGWLDLCVAGETDDAPGEGRLRLWRNNGAGRWVDVSETSGINALELPAIHDLVAADLDGDGDTDLLLVTGAGLRFLRNDGGHRHRQIKIRMEGRKTNPSGIGVHLEVRREEFWVTRAVAAPFVEIGLGNRARLDTVQIIWTNGIVDNEIDIVVPRQPLTLVEKNVPAGSCPYLYAWDGEGFRFVTDILGNSPLGLPVRRGLLMPSDPDELAWIGTADSFLPRQGAYVVQVTDELREVLYLDEARLVAADHRPEVEVHATDKLVAPPFPPSQLWPLTAARAPRQAHGDDGVDRTEAVRTTDGVYAPPGPPLTPPVHGMTHPLALTLDFGVLLPARHLVLALTGWLQYGDASTNIALSQNSDVTVMPPRLEVEVASDLWTPVDVAVGMPAGKTKTILVDLDGKLPPGARRLRLLTSFELRWDRIALFTRAPREALRVHESPPASARLAWRGFSTIETRAPGHPITPAFDAVSDRPPWRTTPQGWATRYGDVLDLVTERDGQLVIASGGDALQLTFDVASFPPVPAGYTRSFFLYAVGWDKALDPNAVDGDTIAPLPGVGETDEAWRLEYNTRWIPGKRFQPAR